MIDNGERLLTVKDVAKYLQVSEATVRRMIATDEPDEQLPFVQVGALLRVRQEDLDDWIKRHTR